MVHEKDKFPTQTEFRRGIKNFRKFEPREPMYKVATDLIEQSWGHSENMADGLGVLLLTWNQAFYRYGSFSFKKLENCISSNLQDLKIYRSRNIHSLDQKDEQAIRYLFDSFLKALRIDSGKKKGCKSPVAVAKALHLLAPSFFPLWDAKIAAGYECRYHIEPANRYIEFSRKIAAIAEVVKKYDEDKKVTVLKLIDEYNYAKFTLKRV
ncbi:MAG TPA: hypothetical protein VGM92_11750 [Candidatus Kapabacteria bacterium]